MFHVHKLVEKSLLNIQVTYRFVVQPARSPLSIIRWFPSRSPGGLLEKAGVGDWEERESMLPVGVSSLGELWLSARKETASQKDTKRFFSWAKGAALVTMSWNIYKKKPYCPIFTGYFGGRAIPQHFPRRYHCTISSIIIRRLSSQHNVFPVPFSTCVLCGWNARFWGGYF